MVAITSSAPATAVAETEPRQRFRHLGIVPTASMITGAALRLMRVTYLDAQAILLTVTETANDDYSAAASAGLDDMATFAPLTEIAAGIHIRATVRMFMTPAAARATGDTASLSRRVGEDRLDGGDVEERADVELSRQIIIAVDADEQIVFQEQGHFWMANVV